MRDIFNSIFQSIPAPVRKALLVLFVVLVLVRLLAEAFIDLNYEAIDRALTLVGGYLALQSAPNVAPAPKRKRNGLPEGE